MFLDNKHPVKPLIAEPRSHALFRLWFVSSVNTIYSFLIIFTLFTAITKHATLVYILICRARQVCMHEKHRGPLQQGVNSASSKLQPLGNMPRALPTTPLCHTCNMKRTHRKGHWGSSHRVYSTGSKLQSLGYTHRAPPNTPLCHTYNANRL